jgi:hypothetical protein
MDDGEMVWVDEPAEEDALIHTATSTIHDEVREGSPALEADWLAGDLGSDLPPVFET